MSTQTMIQKLGAELCNWGAGHDAINVVGTNMLSGRIVEHDILLEAADMLERNVVPANRGLHGWTKKDGNDLRSMVKQLRELAALDSFTQAYVECALWASSDNEAGDSFDDLGYGVDDIAPDCLKKMIKDCAKFEEVNAGLLIKAGTLEQSGHDFWLSRNGHGTGFADRGYAGDLGDKLDAAADKFGSCDLYLGDDKKIHCS